MSKLFKTMNTIQFPEWTDESNAIKKYASQITMEDWMRISKESVDSDGLVEELDFLCTRTIEPNIFFNPRFLALDNVVLQPHMASGTFETRKAMGKLVFDNLSAHFEGRPLPTPVL